MKIESKVAFVTGAASGLGAACALMISEAGGYVVLADIDETRGAERAACLSNETLFVKTDVSSAASVEAAMAAARERFGRIDIAINCAGVLGAARTLGKDGPMPLENFERTVRVNLIGSFNVSRLAAAAMASNSPDENGERGVIVLTASVAAYDGQMGQVAYSASKGGVAAMTLPLARDLARNGIRVMTIAPGIFDTPMLAALPEEIRAALAANVPFPAKLGQPAQYAHLARHIIENSYLNGETIRLDAALRLPPK
ncbi:MAG: SDR family NAD(P)-dependent oxidoreductase [Bryobacteraceae bacterium]